MKIQEDYEKGSFRITKPVYLELKKIYEENKHKKEFDVLTYKKVKRTYIEYLIKHLESKWE